MEALTPSPAARKAAATITVRFAVIIVLGLSSVLTARVLDPTGRGTYGLVIAISWIAAALGHLSIEQAAVLRWQRGDSRRAIASTSCLLGLLGGSAAALVTFVVLRYSGTASFSSHDKWLITVALPTVPLNILGGYLVGLHVLGDRLRRVNLVRLITATSQLAVLAALWITHDLNVTTAVVVWVVTLAAGPVILLLPGLSIRPRYLSRELARSLLKTGLKYHVGLTAVFLLRRIDTVMLSALANRREVGLYVVAVVLAELVFLPGESVAQVILPRQVAGSLQEAAAYTAPVVRVATIAGVAGAAALAAVSPLVIVFAYGRDYVGSIVPLLVLLPGVIAVCLTRPVTAILVRLDRPFIVSLTYLAALALNVALNLALIPVLGAVGAAAASSIAYTAQAIAYTCWLLSSTRLRLADFRPTRNDLSLLLAFARRDRSQPSG